LIILKGLFGFHEFFSQFIFILFIDVFDVGELAEEDVLSFEAIVFGEESHEKEDLVERGRL